MSDGVGEGEGGGCLNGAVHARGCWDGTRGDYSFGGEKQGMAWYFCRCCWIKVYGDIMPFIRSF